MCSLNARSEGPSGRSLWEKWGKVKEDCAMCVGGDEFRLIAKGGKTSGLGRAIRVFVRCVISGKRSLAIRLAHGRDLVYFAYLVSLTGSCGEG